MLTAKLSPCYSTYLLFNLWLNNRTITRFIADDKVVYQRMRWEMRLAWDNSWARRRLKHLSWRSRWIILYTLEQTIAVSCKILRVDRCLFWLFHLTEHKVLYCCATNAVYSAAWLPQSCTRLVDSFKQTVDASNFPTIVRKFTQRPSCTIPFWQIEILNHNLIFLWNFHAFVYFLQIFRSQQFPVVKQVHEIGEIGK